jgi:hypothetical protein
MSAKIKNSTNKVSLKNLSNRPVLLRLNSGETLHLAPRQISREITKGEILNNQMIQKLVERGVIPEPETESKKKKAESLKKISPKKKAGSSKKASLKKKAVSTKDKK